VKKTILIFGALVFALLVLFQLSKYSFMAGHIKLDIIIAGIAILFFVLGIYLRKKKTPSSREPSVEVNQEMVQKLGLSPREYEVLLEVAKGHSNLEIAHKLFVTESTIKTHVSNVLLKLDVKRRTQAIQKAKDLQLLPF